MPIKHVAWQAILELLAIRKHLNVSQFQMVQRLGLKIDYGRISDTCPRAVVVKKLKGRDAQLPAFQFIRKNGKLTLSACELNYPMQFFAASMNVQRF